ncbi:MAG: hypothetical protein CMJ76_11485 [Planctomycetaceae bacterium]|nr:hypothetical protein [Planctomycetaceae bacterium]
MTDDHLPEEPEQNAELQQQSTVTPVDTPPENRSDDEHSVPEDLQDRLRKRFSSTGVVVTTIVAIIVISLIVGLFIRESGPGEISEDWSELNRQVVSLRDAVNQNVFELPLFSTAADTMTDDNAKAWFNVEIASALIATALRPENTPQQAPQFRQQQPTPNILAGDLTTIQNRVTSLQNAATHLETALVIFNTTEAKTHPLGTLGLYRAEYSAAYVSEALLILEGTENYTSNREKVISHLQAATAALPPTQDIQNNSTDLMIHRLRTQIEKRLTAFETMSVDQLSTEQLSDLTNGVPDSAIYSWINQYITQQTAQAPVPDSGVTEEIEDLDANEVINAADDGDFPVNETENIQDSEVPDNDGNNEPPDQGSDTDE